MLKRRSHLLNGMKIRFDARNGESGRKVEFVLTQVTENLFVRDKTTLLRLGIGAP